MGNLTTAHAAAAADEYLERMKRRFLFLACSRCGGYGDVAVPAEGAVYDSDELVCEDCWELYDGDVEDLVVS